MPLLDAFVGGSYKALNATTAADLCINLYQETRRAEGSAKQKWLLGTPGRKFFASTQTIAPSPPLSLVIPSSGVTFEGREPYVVINSTASKGLPPGVLAWAGYAPTVAIGATSAVSTPSTSLPHRGSFTQDGLTLAVFGSSIYHLDPVARTLTKLGTIPDNGEPVSYASNGLGGNQIAVCGGGQVKIINRVTLTVTAVNLPFTDPVQLAFMDGYFLLNQRNTPTVWFSALEDGLIWDALDFIGRSGTSDNVIGIGVSQDRLWVFGSKTTSLFYDSGDADTPFLPYPGTAVQMGAVTPWAIWLRNDIFTWLAQDGAGQFKIVKASGNPAPNVISTPPIEQWLRGCLSLDGAECLGYQQDGHAFYALTCPLSPDDVKTYVWDDTENVWHARAGWDATFGAFTRWPARGVVQVNGLVLVGDYQSGDLFTLDPTTYDDNGGFLVALRRMPYVSDDPSVWLFLDQIELAGQVGVGLTNGQGITPNVSLRISRDAAQTWVSAGFASMGALGDYLARAVWRRLGRVRADRLVIEVSQSDPVRRAWLGLALKSTVGMGQA